MSTNALPKPHTQEDADRESVEQWKNGTDRDRLLIMLSTFTRSQTLPATDDLNVIHANARRDFRNLDFSEAATYVDSAAQVAEFYRDLAEQYLSVLTAHGFTMNEWGGSNAEPFILLDEAEHFALGQLDLVRMSDYESRDDLWDDYVRGYLPFASDREKAWIADNFAEQIGKDEAA